MTTDCERDDQRTTLLLAVEAILTSAERTAFLARFPAQRGAHVADLLDILHSNDSNIEIIEPLLDRYGDKVPEPGLLATAIQLAIGIHSSRLLTHPWECLEPLVERIRPLLGAYYTHDDLRDERAKRETLEELGPLGFVDAEDGESPRDIYHTATGMTFDHRKVNLANIVTVAFNNGRGKGADELRGQFLKMMGAAPRNHFHPREEGE